MTTPGREFKSKRFLRAVLLAGMLAGTLDITAAVMQTLLRGGNPVKMFQFIASGVFGTDAFSGGGLYALYGLLFHFVIAFAWTLLFFTVFGTVKRLSQHRLLTGVVYGILVWSIMNLVVLPLSNTPPLPLKWASALSGMTILIVALGIPLSFLSTRYYFRKS